LRDGPMPGDLVERAFHEFLLAPRAAGPESYSWEAHGLESVVTWTLTPTSTGTTLRKEQSGFQPDQEQFYQGAKMGWGNFFAKLEHVLARTD